MRFPAALGLLCFLASATFASGQVSVSAQTEQHRHAFLLYERVDLLVTVTNTGEADVVLDNDAGRPWLSFLLTSHDHMPIRPERQALFKPIALKVGQSQTLRINLTPLFSFREEGNYNVSAVVDLPGSGDMSSQEVPFTVMRGRTIWTQQRPVEGGDRTYSLIRFCPKADETELYLRVEDPSANVVYANIGLGNIEAYVDPQVSFDPQGNIHIMHLLAMSTYLYTRANAEGKIEHQGVFKVFQEIAPKLSKMDDGSIYVAGGLEETPDTVRESLSTGQGNGHTSTKQPVADNAGIPPTGSPPDATPLPTQAPAPVPALNPQAASH